MFVITVSNRELIETCWSILVQPCGPLVSSPPNSYYLHDAVYELKRAQNKWNLNQSYESSAEKMIFCQVFLGLTGTCFHFMHKFWWYTTSTCFLLYILRYAHPGRRTRGWRGRGAPAGWGCRPPSGRSWVRPSPDTASCACTSWRTSASSPSSEQCTPEKITKIESNSQ